MKRNLNSRIAPGVVLATLALVGTLHVTTMVGHGVDQARTSYIIQGQSLASVRTLVTDLGGEITHELGVINAVAADLNAGQVAELRSNDAIRKVYGNGTIGTAGTPDKGCDTGTTGSPTDNFYTTVVTCDAEHQMDINGSGIAALDTGHWEHNGIE